MSDHTDVPWLSDSERHAWVAFSSMLMMVPPAIDAQLKRDSGINFFEYSILASLSNAPDHTVRMSTLADLAYGSLSRLSHAVSRLERQGWVRRRAADNEPRCILAVLTDEGMNALVEAAPNHVREVRRMIFDALTPEQVGQLESIGRQLLLAAAPHMNACLERESTR
ncbi:MarR family winged helix-turn-helix transcriptional regulator [Actinoplanes sp. GCM10030250]|uniref:MarR family winged helix-turn-helix transcriptional regulator n=1 Tax=Actinoplanes sp. GCM10030250 TaxID=3273376 RepID=UPI00361BDE41